MQRNGHDWQAWRTPNQWWFVQVCQRCGEAVTSVLDGGDVLRKANNAPPCGRSQVESFVSAVAKEARI